jgi:hypothetical protein
MNETGSSEVLIGLKTGKSLMSLYGTIWRERGSGLSSQYLQFFLAVRLNCSGFPEEIQNRMVPSWPFLLS